MKATVLVLAAALGIGLVGAARSADEAARHDHHHTSQDAAAAAASVPMKDQRLLVRYPDALRIHTLANMRDHLQTLGAIQAALAAGAFDQASELAETRLGMSSLQMHGAHEVARFMPQGMQDAGTAMHRAASQFALVAKDASATGDLKPVLAAMSRLNQTCVSCHARFRLQ